MNDVWFSTLGSSAQVLAALVGLFAVFVVFKLQGLSSFSDVLKPHIVRHIRSYLRNDNFLSLQPSQLRELPLRSNEELQELFASILRRMTTKDQQPTMNTFISSFDIEVALNDETYQLFDRVIKTIRNIVQRLRVMLIISLLSIAYCVFCLSFQSFLIPWASTLIVVNFGIVLINLFLIGKYTYNIIEH